MAASPYATTQYNSEQFVESCGAILFDLSDKQNKKVCLVYYRAGNEWLLAKGRRNCGESRHEAALREIREETGYQARLYPVTMHTRAPPIDEQGHMPDKPRSYPDITEPFMVTIRQLGGHGGNDIKMIWWYVAVLEGQVAGGGGEEDFMPKFFPLEEAKKMLSFQNDLAVLEQAIKLANLSTLKRKVMLFTASQDNSKRAKDGAEEESDLRRYLDKTPGDLEETKRQRDQQETVKTDSPILTLPLELVLSITDLLDDIETTCLALSCTQLWSTLKSQRVKLKSGCLNLIDSEERRGRLVLILSRDLPKHIVCDYCARLYEVDMSDKPSLPHRRFMTSNTLCDLCSQFLHRLPLDFQLQWSNGYKMLHRIHFSDVKLAIQRFSDQKSGYSINSLNHTQVACLKPKTVDPETELEADTNQLLTSIEAMIIHSEPEPPTVSLRIQHIMTARARKRDDSIMDYNELPHPCFHIDLLYMSTEFAKKLPKQGEEHHDRSFHCRDTCDTCMVDYQLDIVNDTDTGYEFTLVLTRWINLGSGSSPQDIQWKAHSAWYGTVENSHLEPRFGFETFSSQSHRALRASNLFYLENQNYRSLMQRSHQEPSVWVLRSPRNWAHQTAKRIADSHAGFEN
ncbi:unnamed protein product [Penicillium salamii]|nr:unnamed protein product [Penicillium salamii]